MGDAAIAIDLAAAPLPNSVLACRICRLVLEKKLAIAVEYSRYSPLPHSRLRKEKHPVCEGGLEFYGDKPPPSSIPQRRKRRCDQTLASTEPEKFIQIENTLAGSAYTPSGRLLQRSDINDLVVPQPFDELGCGKNIYTVNERRTLFAANYHAMAERTFLRQRFETLQVMFVYARRTLRLYRGVTDDKVDFRAGLSPPIRDFAITGPYIKITPQFMVNPSLEQMPVLYGTGNRLLPARQPIRHELYHSQGREFNRKSPTMSAISD